VNSQSPHFWPKGRPLKIFLGELFHYCHNKEFTGVETVGNISIKSSKKYLYKTIKCKKKIFGGNIKFRYSKVVI